MFFWDFFLCFKKYIKLYLAYQSMQCALLRAWTALPQLCWSVTLLHLSPTVSASSCKGDAVFSVKFGNDTLIGFLVAYKCGLTFLTFWPPIMSRKHVGCWDIERSVRFHRMGTFLVPSSSWTFCGPSWTFCHPVSSSTALQHPVGYKLNGMGQWLYHGHCSDVSSQYNWLPSPQRNIQWLKWILPRIL